MIWKTGTKTTFWCQTASKTLCPLRAGRYWTSLSTASSPAHPEAANAVQLQHFVVSEVCMDDPGADAPHGRGEAGVSVPLGLAQSLIWNLLPLLRHVGCK